MESLNKNEENSKIDCVRYNFLFGGDNSLELSSDKCGVGLRSPATYLQCYLQASIPNENIQRGTAPHTLKYIGSLIFLVSFLIEKIQFLGENKSFKKNCVATKIFFQVGTEKTPRLAEVDLKSRCVA